MRVAAKWGFGNAPLKRSQCEMNERAARCVLKLLTEPHIVATRNDLDCLSHIKGQFSRTFRQDQWDWYTVGSLSVVHLAMPQSTSLASWRLYERGSPEVSVVKLNVLGCG